MADLKLVHPDPEAPKPTPRFEWERLVRRAALPPEVLGMALLLATYANADGSKIHPGNDRLCRVTGLSDKTVRRHLEALRASGLIVRVETQQSRARRKLADCYQLTCPHDFLDRPGVLDPEERRSPMTADTPVTHDQRQTSDGGHP